MIMGVGVDDNLISMNVICVDVSNGVFGVSRGRCLDGMEECM
jgi:hypothetical protein